MRHVVRALGSSWYAVAAFTALCALTGNPFHTQIAAAGTTPPAPAKSILFEVASIKPGREDEPLVQQVLPDGFLLTGSSVTRLICLAYDRTLLFNNRNRLRNIPDWVRNDTVDVLAKVSTEEAADWQRETTSSLDSPTFKHALQQLLVERYKLQVHTIPIEADGYALVLKRFVPNAKLVQADKVRTSPDNSPGMAILPGGVIRFHNQPLSGLALFISSLSPSIVEDGTGLSDSYDFSISDRLPVHPTAEESEDLMLPDERWDLEPLGLKLVHSKVHTTALVIDHIERPSLN